MNIRTLLMIFIVVIGISTGQVLFKAAALKSKDSALGFVYSLAVDPVFLLALVIYGLVTLLWVYILSSVRLSTAYPFMTISFVITPFLASYFFSEPLEVRYWIGMSAIVAGLLVMHYD